MAERRKWLQAFAREQDYQGLVGRLEKQVGMLEQAAASMTD